MKSLKEFLNAKPLYYDEIDYSRFPRAFEAIKNELEIKPIIHIIGTNGKGSTGRFLALILKANGKKVGHYTSPHIFDFNERFWLNGALASDDELELAHKELLEIFKKTSSEHFIEKLSYFEWATLLACVLFRGFDEWIFEAGLGGEHDATNALPKALSIFTPIGLDHRAFLGDSLDSIATTKLNAMSKNAIISAFFARLNIAKNIAKQKGASLKIAPKYATSNASKIYLKHKSLFLRQNFALALFSAKSLGAKWDKSVLAKMSEFDLQARAQKIYPNLLIDAGHNEHAAKAIKTHLLSTFGKRATTLVFNSFDDKDIKAVLSILAPCLKRILLYTYESSWRKLGTQNAHKIANELGIPCCDFNKTEFLKELKSRKNNFLVFGSFMLVGEFLKEFNEFKKK